MGKHSGLRIACLVALLLFACVVCVGTPLGLFDSLLYREPSAQEVLSTQGSAPEETAETTPPTEPATQPTVETTEPFEMPPITWKTYPEDRALTCTQAFVYDMQSERYLYLMGEPADRVYPASITKLMSIHVASLYLDPTWELVAGNILDRIPEDASVAKLEKGDIMTVEMLLEGMLLPSGNDAAYLIATEAGREIAGDPDLPVDDAIAVFVEEMNRCAQELGMTGTVYKNPDGWHDEGHYTNFDDLVTLSKLALDNDVVKKYATVPKTTVSPAFGHEKEWINTNLLVNPETVYFCPYAIGLKTGQTDAAGSCLLSAFDIEGHRYIIGVFGSPTYDEKLDDTIQLLNEVVMSQ